MLFMLITAYASIKPSFSLSLHTGHAVHFAGVSFFPGGGGVLGTSRGVQPQKVHSRSFHHTLKGNQSNRLYRH